LKAYGGSGSIAIDEAIMKLNDIDDKMSVFKSGSDVSGINNNAGILPQVVSTSTYFVLKKAFEYCQLTGGAFDPTIRPLVRLWNKGIEWERIPDEAAIKEKLPLVNFNDILFDEAEKAIKLRNKGQEIDLGGIAKGFAAEEVRDIFIKRSIRHALIDLGGNIYALGSKPDGTPWNVGIQNPFKPRGQYLGILKVKNKSVVTSGNYEKYFIKDGRMFHHIIDPRKGFPSESNIVSATIISDNSIDGDGLSTGIYILGVEKALELIESLRDIDAVLVTGDKKVFMTPGIEKYFELTDNNFSIVRSCDRNE
jgi:thiamine biosynthesis lipoprotein